MQATNSRTSIKRWKDLLLGAKIFYTSSPSGNEIIFKGPGRVDIQVNHNGEKHWTIRIPGTAQDGMRFHFGADVVIDTISSLIIINGILAIRYV